MVTSSCVGPTPPLVKSQSCDAGELADLARDGVDVVHHDDDAPEQDAERAQARARGRATLASSTFPERISSPMTSAAAVGGRRRGRRRGSSTRTARSVALDQAVRAVRGGTIGAAAVPGELPCAAARVRSTLTLDGSCAGSCRRGFGLGSRVRARGARGARVRGEPTGLRGRRGEQRLRRDAPSAARAVRPHRHRHQHGRHQRPRAHSLHPQVGAPPRRRRSLIISTLRAEHDVERGLALGANAYLPKPFTPEQLRGDVRTARSRRPRRPPSGARP